MMIMMMINAMYMLTQVARIVVSVRASLAIFLSCYPARQRIGEADYCFGGCRPCVGICVVRTI